MRKIPLIFVFLILPFLGLAQEIPLPRGRVNDFAQVIDQETFAKINALVQEAEAKTSAEITVVTIASIAPYDEKEYARMLFDNWKPGKKGKDNGVIVLLAIKERRWRIETGYGVEGILPDGLCGEIGRDYMVPYFKQGKYGEGLYQGVRAIADVIAKDAHITLDVPANFSAAADNFSPAIIFLIVFIMMGILPAILAHRSRFYYRGTGYSGGGSWGGGGFGGGGFGGGGGGGGGAGGGF